MADVKPVSVVCNGGHVYYKEWQSDTPCPFCLLRQLEELRAWKKRVQTTLREIAIKGTIDG